MPASALTGRQPWRRGQGGARVVGRTLAAAVVGLLLLTAAKHASAAPEPVATRAVLRCPPSVRARFAAELRAVGVHPMPPSSGPAANVEGLRDDARERGATAVVWVAGDLLSVTVVLVAAPQPAHRTLSRERHETTGALALRAAELLHALLSAPRPKAAQRPSQRPPTPAKPAPAAPEPATLRAAAEATDTPASRPETKRAARQIDTPKVKSPSEKDNDTGVALAASATPADDAAATPRPDRPAAWWSIRAGALLDGGPGGLGAAGMGRLAIARSLPGTRDWALSVLIEMPLTDHEVRGTAGVSVLHTWIAGAELRWRAWRRQRWSVWAEGGGGVAFLSATGRPLPGYDGVISETRTAAGWLGGATEVWLSGPVFARLEAGVLMVGPKPVLVTDDARAASWGRPTLRAALTLELRL